jgi:hypothetical protein
LSIADNDTRILLKYISPPLIVSKIVYSVSDWSAEVRFGCFDPWVWAAKQPADERWTEVDELFRYTARVLQLTVKRDVAD